MVLTCCGASVDEILTDYARYRLCWKPQMPPPNLSPIKGFEGHLLHHCSALSCGCMTHHAGKHVGAMCRSDDVGAVALGGMEKEELKGLDVSVFSRAPPQALLATLEHLRCGRAPLQPLYMCLAGRERPILRPLLPFWCSSNKKLCSCGSSQQA